MISFLIVKCPSAFNGVLSKPLLKALKVVTSIHCLTTQFPIAAGIGQVRGRQRDFKECFSRLLELAKIAPELTQAMEVGKTHRGPMEINIDPCLQEDESTARPMEELIKT